MADETIRQITAYLEKGATLEQMLKANEGINQIKFVAFTSTCHADAWPANPIFDAEKCPCPRCRRLKEQPTPDPEAQEARLAPEWENAVNEAEKQFIFIEECYKENVNAICTREGIFANLRSRLAALCPKVGQERQAPEASQPERPPRPDETAEWVKHCNQAGVLQSEAKADFVQSGPIQQPPSETTTTEAKLPAEVEAVNDAVDDFELALAGSVHYEEFKKSFGPLLKVLRKRLATLWPKAGRVPSVKDGELDKQLDDILRHVSDNKGWSLSLVKGCIRGAIADYIYRNMGQPAQGDQPVSLPPLVAFDECECGDYRHQHSKGLFGCIMPDDACHGCKPCKEFRLSQRATGFPSWVKVDAKPQPVTEIVSVVVANEQEKVKVCEVYADNDQAWKRFEELKQVYGGANVCLSSRTVIGSAKPSPVTAEKLAEKIRTIPNPWKGEIDFHQNIRLATRQGFEECREIVLQMLKAFTTLVQGNQPELAEQLQVQLAGCSTAALGNTKNPAKKGDYGWSPAYQDVLELRWKFDALSQERLTREQIEAAVGKFQAKLPTTLAQALKIVGFCQELIDDLMALQPQAQVTREQWEKLWPKGYLTSHRPTENDIRAWLKSEFSMEVVDHE